MTRTRLAALAAFLALAAPAHAAQSSAGSPDLPQTKGAVLERIIVRVNGEIFTQSQLIQAQTDEIRSKNVDPRNITDTAVLRMIQEVTPDVLVKSVDEMLLVQRGREIGLKFTDEAFKNGVENLKKDNKLDDAGLAAAMKQEGLTMEQLRTNFERAFLREQTVNEEIFRRMHVTEEELRQYYSAHKDQFTTPETVTLRELYVAAAVAPNSQVRPEDNAAAKARIDALRARAVAGEDFETLVKSSSDAATKSSGGLIGPLDLAEVSPSVKDLVASLKVGEVSQPLAMPRGGYNMFKMEARSTPEVLPFDKVKPQIEQKVRESRLDTELEKLLTRLRAQAVIEWKDENYKKLYEQGLGAVSVASNENR